MKLPSQNQSRVFTREWERTLEGFCVIKCNPWSLSDYVSPLHITSRSLHSSRNMILARVCDTVWSVTFWSNPFPRSDFSIRSSSFFGRAEIRVCVTSNEHCCSVARVTLCVRLAHPFSTDGTAKSHVVTLSPSGASSSSALSLFGVRKQVRPLDKAGLNTDRTIGYDGVLDQDF